MSAFTESGDCFQLNVCDGLAKEKASGIPLSDERNTMPLFSSIICELLRTITVLVVRHWLPALSHASNVSNIINESRLIYGVE